MGDHDLEGEEEGDDSSDVRCDTGCCICGAGSGSFESESVSVSTFDSGSELSARDFSKFSLLLLLKVLSKVTDVASLIFLSIGSQIFQI